MPIDRATLDRQLAHLADSDRWAGRAEVNELPAMLNSGERILAATTGWLVESGKLSIRTWLVLVTSARLICVLKGGSTGFRKVELSIDAMKAAYTDARLGYHEVIIEGSAGKTIVSGLPKDSAVALATALAAQITARHEVAEPAVAAPVTPAPPAPPDGADITLRELVAYVEKVQQLEANQLQMQKRLAALEDVIRRAAARQSASNPAN